MNEGSRVSEPRHMVSSASSMNFDTHWRFSSCSPLQSVNKDVNGLIATLQLIFDGCSIIVCIYRKCLAARFNQLCSYLAPGLYSG